MSAIVGAVGVLGKTGDVGFTKLYAEGGVRVPKVGDIGGAISVRVGATGQSNFCGVLNRVSVVGAVGTPGRVGAVGLTKE